eukprot:PhM_4_TR12422/c0_g1_i2/m.86826/K03574/mutT, NUDT15, MTH2; 8-oxo-dGTP diphosphatase
MAAALQRREVVLIILLFLSSLYIIKRDTSDGDVVVNHGPGPFPACAPYPARVLPLYNDLKYQLRTPDLAIDALIRVYDAADQQRLRGVVLCHRNRPPYRLAIPGGYVEYGETVEAAAEREMLEETSIRLYNDSTTSMRQYKVYSNPLRDKRRHTVSVVFDIIVRDQTPKAGDDVKTCETFPVSKLPRDPAIYAFDHYTVLTDFLREKGLMWDNDGHHAP